METVVTSVRELCEQVDRLLAGAVTRTEVQAWARAVSTYERPAFRGNAAADGLHTCLYNLDQRHGDDWLVRDADLRMHLDVVRRGIAILDEVPLATFHETFDALTARVPHAVRWRFAIEGLGWFEEARFASLSTNRVFAMIAALTDSFGPRCSLHTTPGTVDDAVRADAAATLGLATLPR